MNIRFVFIGGMGRSGTNLLRKMLDCHSLIAGGPEFNHIEAVIQTLRKLRRDVELGKISQYISEDDLYSSTAEYLRALLEGYAQKRGKRILLEKTPSNIWSFPELSRLYPDAFFIEIIRDGRDVVASHLEVGQRLSTQGEPITMSEHSPILCAYHCAGLWSETIKLGMSLKRCEPSVFDPSRLLTVRYEALVSDPLRTVQGICDHIRVDFEEPTLAPESQNHDTFVDGVWVTKRDIGLPLTDSHVGRWAKDLRFRDRILVRASAQEALKALGYVEDASWVFSGLSPLDPTLKTDLEAVREVVERHAREKESSDK